MAAILMQRRLQGSGGGFFDRGFVHAGGEKVADFLLIGRTHGRGVSSLLEQAPKEELILVRQLAVHVPASLVRGNWIVLDPGSTGVLVKVYAGLGGEIYGL
jgi:hypothetical protein